MVDLNPQRPELQGFLPGALPKNHKKSKGARIDTKKHNNNRGTKILTSSKGGGSGARINTSTIRYDSREPKKGTEIKTSQVSLPSSNISNVPSGIKTLMEQKNAQLENVKLTLSGYSSWEHFRPQDLEVLLDNVVKSVKTLNASKLPENSILELHLGDNLSGHDRVINKKALGVAFHDENYAVVAVQPNISYNVVENRIQHELAHLIDGVSDHQDSQYSFDDEFQDKISPEYLQFLNTHARGRRDIYTRDPDSFDDLSKYRSSSFELFAQAIEFADDHDLPEDLENYVSQFYSDQTTRQVYRRSDDTIQEVNVLIERIARASNIEEAKTTYSNAMKKLDTIVNHSDPEVQYTRAVAHYFLAKHLDPIVNQEERAKHATLAIQIIDSNKLVEKLGLQDNSEYTKARAEAKGWAN